MANLQQVGELLEEDIAALPTQSLNRQRLLDMATTISLTTQSLDQFVERYSEVAGSESAAREARTLLQRVKRLISWVQAYGHVAAEEELYRRVLAAHCYANRSVSLVQDMRRHRDEVWDALLELHQMCVELAAG